MNVYEAIEYLKKSKDNKVRISSWKPYHYLMISINGTCLIDRFEYYAVNDCTQAVNHYEDYSMTTKDILSQEWVPCNDYDEYLYNLSVIRDSLNERENDCVGRLGDHIFDLNCLYEHSQSCKYLSLEEIEKVEYVNSILHNLKRELEKRRIKCV